MSKRPQKIHLVHQNRSSFHEGQSVERVTRWSIASYCNTCTPRSNMCTPRPAMRSSRHAFAPAPRAFSVLTQASTQLGQGTMSGQTAQRRWSSQSSVHPALPVANWLFSHVGNKILVRAITSLGNALDNWSWNTIWRPSRLIYNQYSERVPT